jgi:glutaredoxin 3
MGKHVTIYTTPACGGCMMLKTFLKSNDIAFEEIDVATSPEIAQEAIRRSGQMSVPLIDIDGAMLVGFDKDELSNALGLVLQGKQR